MPIVVRTHGYSQVEFDRYFELEVSNSIPKEHFYVNSDIEFNKKNNIISGENDKQRSSREGAHRCT